MADTLLVTGGAGFIGSALVRHLIRETLYSVVNVDKLTYAGHPSTVESVASDPRYAFERADVCDAASLERVFQQYEPAGVIHLAAESHVDRSIDGPAEFVRTNVVGTYNVLEMASHYRASLPAGRRTAFRLLHVSTDEVYGTLGEEGAFAERTAYDPRSPYSATKAASDHLARAWHHTYGLPVLVTNTCNNFGPYQFPEKLIPLAIRKAVEGEAIPVYGDGQNVRDWIYVEDHVRGLLSVFQKGRPGETYLIGARQQRRNIDTVRALCKLVDRFAPDPSLGPRERLIEFVEDRPGHDRRYAVDPTKIETELGFRPRESFESGLEKTVRWYLEHRDWSDRVTGDTYRGERLGLVGGPR